jgi:hypothetical protein
VISFLHTQISRQAAHSSADPKATSKYRFLSAAAWRLFPLAKFSTLIPPQNLHIFVSILVPIFVNRAAIK